MAFARGLVADAAQSEVSSGALGICEFLFAQEVIRRDASLEIRVVLLIRKGTKGKDGAERSKKLKPVEDTNRAKQGGEGFWGQSAFGGESREPVR